MDKDLMLMPVDENRTLEKVVLDIGALKEATDNMKKAYTELSDTLKNFMREKGFKKLETDTVTVTYKEAGTREVFDVKAFKADYPEIYDEYATINDTTDSVLVKVKKTEEVAE